MIELIRRVVKLELAQQRGSLLAVVTRVFPHTQADDDHNYEVDVRLKHEELELQRVPVAVGHIGLAAPPRIDDLVLVQFVNGDLNQPLVTGRFYHADDRPPLHRADELLFEQRLPDGTLNQLRFASDGTIYLQRDVTRPEDNSAARASMSIDGDRGTITAQVGDGVILRLTSDNRLEIHADQINIQGPTTITGDLVVQNQAGVKTTISGNEITGG